MIGTDVSHAAMLLRQGQLVAIPTETVYGLAADATNPEAVASIYKLKSRPQFNPLILHVSSIAEAKKYCDTLTTLEIRLCEAFWPGPLTLIVKKRNVIDLVTAGLDTVGIRVPKSDLTQALLNQLNFPLAAPSANPSNAISPTSANHVERMFGSEAPYILDGGSSLEGIESTIVRCQENTIQILREGTISREMLERFAPVKSVSTVQVSAPGQLSKHYAPSKKLIVVDKLEDIGDYANDKKVSVLAYTETRLAFYKTYYLSKNNSYTEIASNLFESLHRADADDSDVIAACWVKEEGIGRAINDKLRRAQFKG